MNQSQETGLPIIFLKPKDVYLAEKPTIVITVLGSCVSTTMFNRRLRMGAICHSFLPECRNNQESCNGIGIERFKYVNCSISWMVKKLGTYGITPEEIEVKLFGGADMVPSQGGDTRITKVGSENVKIAIEAIEAEGLNLASSNVGEAFGRKIYFYTHTGEVLLKRIGETEVLH